VKELTGDGRGFEWMLAGGCSGGSGNGGICSSASVFEDLTGVVGSSSSSRKLDLGETRTETFNNTLD
jgi:hypothetical protein